MSLGLWKSAIRSLRQQSAFFGYRGSESFWQSRLPLGMTQKRARSHAVPAAVGREERESAAAAKKETTCEEECSCSSLGLPAESGGAPGPSAGKRKAARGSREAAAVGMDAGAPAAPADSLCVGCHASTAGGLHNAILEGVQLGAGTVQIFTSNQRQWQQRALSESEIHVFKDTYAKSGLRSIMSHGSYLVNLGASDPALLEKSRKAMRDEILRCQVLSIPLVNYHPGSAGQKGDAAAQECLDRIVESILSVNDLYKTLPDMPKFIIEATAGQGNSVGHRFEHLAHIIRGVASSCVRIGVCLDTCHIFAAGYDIRSAEGWTAVLKEFDAVVGLRYLDALHLNDSKKDLSCRVDRHENLGKGFIGLDCFKFIMAHPLLSQIPKYLETPGGGTVYAKEMAMLRAFRK